MQSPNIQFVSLQPSQYYATWKYLLSFYKTEKPKEWPSGATFKSEGWH